MNWKEIFKEKNEIVLSTFSKKSGSHSIVAVSQGFADGKLLINACQTNTTIENIKEDARVCVISMNGGKYLRIKGTAELFSSGKYFEISKEKNEGPRVKYSIVITIEEVFDLDKVKAIM